MEYKRIPELIVALDLPDRATALELASQLQGAISWCKVGMELFTSTGPSLLEELTKLGYRIFLDLKFYDIPNTVARAVKAVAAVGVDMLTIHCQGGERMCRAVMEATQALPRQPAIFGVTALTSFAAGEMPGINTSPAEFAIDMARSAAAWGLNGVVCSAHEVPTIKTACPMLQCLCPGIRPAGSAANDQRRVMTPAQAVAAGADYLVVGRPITAAPVPFDALQAILTEMMSTPRP